MDSAHTSSRRQAPVSSEQPLILATTFETVAYFKDPSGCPHTGRYIRYEGDTTFPFAFIWDLAK
jgi:hypothetical protein